MTKEERKKAIIIFAAIALVFMVASIFTGGGGEEETVQTVMRDAVMHDVNKVSLFGLKDVNPALIAGFIVSGIMIVFALAEMFMHKFALPGIIPPMILLCSFLCIFLGVFSGFTKNIIAESGEELFSFCRRKIHSL